MIVLTRTDGAGVAKFLLPIELNSDSCALVRVQTQILPEFAGLLAIASLAALGQFVG